MRQPAHTDRRRAEAFGRAASDYHRYRPRYPLALITELVGSGHVRVLDVGAGTGIASMQLREAGADVLAVEPDSRMGQVAVANGIDVERSTFEDWLPNGRSFDLVVFAQSFHWVEPKHALEKCATILRDRGRLVLLSNRLTPITPPKQELDEIYSGYLGPELQSPIDAAHNQELLTLIERHGFEVERRHVSERQHYAADAWVNMVSTHSNILTLEHQARADLRLRLAQRIGDAGVEAENNATAVVCTPSSA